ncbi:HNH endonuclease signature motif containing protein [Agreia sp. COWG]|uniref:HNH endonuclease signature motif containing protein n=1 Tax=Agreia sp. COWG TaxID=2773266 RepID=UPI0019260BD6|nr:HNH endonuclease signature motif containing protein [Agreia sp. COWG]CAD6008487.1 HNHc domain-containing protein [Agreia sp. COWG]
MDLLDASLGDIAARLRELLAADRGASSLAGSPSGSGAGLAGDDLLRAAHQWEAIGRAGDAARIWVAAEIENDSRRELEANGLAYRHGFGSAKKALAATARISERTAGARIALGRQLRSSTSLTGLPLPSLFPAVSTAFFAAQIGADAASMICRTLGEVIPRIGWSEAVDEAERRLVAAACETIAPAPADPVDTADPVDAAADSTDMAPDGDESPPADPCGAVGVYTVDELTRLAMRVREHLDPDGAEPRDAVKQSLRGFSYPKVGADGMARGRYALPPLQLGVFLAAVDSILSPRTAEVAGPAVAGVRGGGAASGEGAGAFEKVGGAGGGASGAVADGDLVDAMPDGDLVDGMPDVRTSQQTLLDAVMALIELAASSPAASRLNGAAPTVNVHVSLSDLEQGRGVGWIDGCTEPIPMSSVEMLRCDGDTIFTLFGAAGEVLNQGKTQRLATGRQRRALAARDGGCVMPGCSAPPSRCQAHHVIPWVSETFALGRTDIGNLALLCPFHHSTIHTSAWRLVMIHGKPHVRLPNWRDPEGVPRPVGKQRVGSVW